MSPKTATDDEDPPRSLRSRPPQRGAQNRRLVRGQPPPKLATAAEPIRRPRAACAASLSVAAAVATGAVAKTRPTVSAAAAPAEDGRTLSRLYAGGRGCRKMPGRWAIAPPRGRGAHRHEE